MSDSAISNPDKAFWPEVCPNCSYSLKELPLPRCPECGEGVAEGEILISGIPVRSSDRELAHNSPEKEIMFYGAFVVVAGAVMVIGSRNIALVGIWAVFLYCLFGAVVWINAVRRKLGGWPRGCITLSSRGFRVGAGPHKTPLRTWSKNYRLQLNERRYPRRLRCLRVWKGIPISTPFHIYLALNQQQVESLRERLAEWTAGKARFKVKRSRRLDALSYSSSDHS